MTRLLAIIGLCILLGAPANARQKRRHHDRAFEATAFSRRGITRSGLRAQGGEVAADPRVLPLGTRIRILDAGPYSGVYTVADTGGRIRGRHIDIFIGNPARARKFGRKTVRVLVLRQSRTTLAERH